MKTKIAPLPVRSVRRTKRAGIPAIYVNDNFERWQSDFRAQHEKSLGRNIAKFLALEEDDYFVLKPQHSGFFSTTLDILNDLGAKTLILTGFAGDICVLYTANDAYMRDYHIIVASDIYSAFTTTNWQMAVLGRILTIQTSQLQTPNWKA